MIALASLIEIESLLLSVRNALSPSRHGAFVPGPVSDRIPESNAHPSYSIAGAVGPAGRHKEVLALAASLPVGEAAVLEADVVCGREHLISAAEHALRAIGRGDAMSSSLPSEAMLYASGERQLRRAIEKAGVDAATERFAIIVFGGGADEAIRHMMLSRDDSILINSKYKMQAIGIPEHRLEGLPEDRWSELALELVAFTPLRK